MLYLTLTKMLTRMMEGVMGSIYVNQSIFNQDSVVFENHRPNYIREVSTSSERCGLRSVSITLMG